MKKRAVSIAIACFSAAMIVSACTGKRGPRYYSREERLRFIKEHHLDKLPSSDVPLEVNERVVAWMDYFSGSGEQHFGRYLSRSSRYIPMMQDILKKHGLPKDLVYVSLIESGFNTHAQSHAAAVGPWQFIKGTARRYGLRVDPWVDERRDPVKSTHAAARYLKDLYREFNHWYLAMAAYNAGEGRVRRAIAESGSKNFWAHADPDKNYYRAETRDYVPKYIAANIMAKMPREFGFCNIDFWKPQEYDTVTVPSQTDLEVAAKCAGARRSELEELNPELSLGATPPGVTNYTLRIPKDRKEQFRVAYAAVPKEERIKLVVHDVRRGESLASIARKYGVSSTALARANGVNRKEGLRTGTQLVIPIGAAYKVRMASIDDEGGGKRSKQRLTYKVRAGDTVGGVARKYGVTVSQIKQWNRLGKRGTIRVGQRLKIYKTTYAGKASKDVTPKSKGAATHRVSSGETLWTIARAYGVSVDDLKDWNGLEDNRIRAGQKLAVRPGSSTSPTSTTSAAVSPDSDASSSDASSSSASSGGSGTHVLALGQTLGHVAEMYGVSTKDLMRWNGIKDPRRVRAGTKLVIKGGRHEVVTTAPAKATKDLALATKESSVEPSSEDAPAIASDAAVPTTSTTSSAEQQPMPTASVTPEATPKTYEIKSGDSLWSIAREHGVSVSDIKKWNGMGESNKIKPGQSIVIKEM